MVAGGTDSHADDHCCHLQLQEHLEATGMGTGGRSGSVSPDRQSSGSTRSADSCGSGSAGSGSAGSRKSSKKRGSPNRRRDARSSSGGLGLLKRSLKRPQSALVAYPLLIGQEVVARCDGRWREAIVVRRPAKQGELVVVETETWIQHSLTLADVALKATYARALRKNPEAAASAMAKAAAHRTARVLRASVPPRAPAVAAAATAVAPGPAPAGLASPAATTQLVGAGANQDQLPKLEDTEMSSPRSLLLPNKAMSSPPVTEDNKAELINRDSSTDTGGNSSSQMSSTSFSSSTSSSTSTTKSNAAVRPAHSDVAEMDVDQEVSRTPTAKTTTTQPLSEEKQQAQRNAANEDALADEPQTQQTRQEEEEEEEEEQEQEKHEAAAQPPSPELLPPPAASKASAAWKSACRPEEAGINPTPLRTVDRSLQQKLAEGSLPGFVNIVWRNGTLAHVECQGYADLERKVPMGVDTIVKLYSMTKCIISVALAICLEEKRLALDDPLAKYLPCFDNMLVKAENTAVVEPADKPITLLHLLTHTSGLGYGPMLGDEADGEGEARFIPLIERAGYGRTDTMHPTAIRTLEEWCNELSKVPLLFHPGSDWLYSYSHDVLGRVIEVVTSQRLDGFLQKRVLGPLGMVDTGFTIPKDKWHRCAGVYRRQELAHEEGEEEAAVQPSPMLSPSPSPSASPAPSPLTRLPKQSLEGEEKEKEKEKVAGTMSEEEVGKQQQQQQQQQQEEEEEEEAESKPASAEPSAPHTPETPCSAAPSSGSRFELQRLDAPRVEDNEWIDDNVSPILAGGGSVDAMTGGLVSTAADYARFCLMLLRKGELDGVRLLKPETVELLTTNQLPRATKSEEVWAFGTPGVGFGLLGSVSVQHPELDAALRAGEYGWGGMAGTAWTNDPAEDFFLLSFSLVAFDLTTEEELRAGVRESIATFRPKEEPTTGRKRIRTKMPEEQSSQPLAKCRRGESGASTDGPPDADLLDDERNEEKKDPEVWTTPDSPLEMKD